mmetsp:Transcript_19534/g.41120  ORF Transcript_19534/g.41120 Transcript_19534/m.41120 type:complete len:381 (+) Transcript_19534:96-1238(+)
MTILTHSKKLSPNHMFSKVDVMSTTTLDQEIVQAESRYGLFRDRLKKLITTLKAHHEVMVKMNESQSMTTKALCEFVLNTPISNCIVGTDDSKPVQEDIENKGEIVTPTEKEENSSKSSEKTSDKNGATPESAVDQIKQEEMAASLHYTNSFDSIIANGKNLDDLDDSFMGIFNASNDINQVYAEKFRENIIGYVVQWDKIVSTRIEGRLIEFRKMRSSYAHYVDKVAGLHEKADKQKAKSKQVPKTASPRLANKLERNVVKLSGAEEAHDDYGRSLLLYIDEVTTTYWKDFVPLLHMFMKFSMNGASDTSVVMRRLEKVDAILKKSEIGVTGRLEALKSSPPEVITSSTAGKETEAGLKQMEEKEAEESADKENDLESV